MTLLQIMDDASATVRLRTDAVDVITNELAKRQVTFSRWSVHDNPNIASSYQYWLHLYATEIEDLNSDGRFTYIDVTFFRLADKYWRDAATARQKFLAEHYHTENEVRFFAAGSACFYLHIDNDVLAVVCTAGDLLSVPAGVRHWFDMGERPDFVAIRFFEQEDGWVGVFTDDPIGERFPTLDQLTVSE